VEGKCVERLTVTEHENGEPVKLGQSQQEEERSVDDENKTEEQMIR
jgi:hypothetical protein